MSGLRCSGVLEESPGFGSLLMWLDRQVLYRHCYQGQSVEDIAATLSMTPDEVVRVHDRASTRLSLAVLRLLIDLDVADPTTLLNEISNQGGQSGQQSKPRFLSNGRDALAA